MEEALSEASALVDVLSMRQAALTATIDGDFPEFRSNVWLSEPSATSAAQFLAPQMIENRNRVDDLLREALILQEALRREVEPNLLERLLPKRWRQYQKGVSGRI